MLKLSYILRDKLVSDL